jgi:hypothetical protein
VFNAIVEGSGPDVYEKEPGIITPYGLCTFGILMKKRHADMI